MAVHLLAVFGRETARAPTGLESWKCAVHSHTCPVLSEEEQKQQEDYCRGTLSRCYSSSAPATRKMEYFGKGSGVSYEVSPFCSYAVRAGVHTLFSGEVSDWPGVNVVSAAHDAFMRNDPPPEENDAHWLLDFYDSFRSSSEDDVLERALECLSMVKGSFAFVIYDELQHRVLAARDAQGAQPLYWGATEDGQLLFGSRLEDLGDCNPTAVAFTPGVLFSSERHTVCFSPGDKGWVIAEDDWPGRLLAFVRSDPEHWRGVKVIPRITSKGEVCGAVYKVASQPDVQQMTGVSAY